MKPSSIQVIISRLVQIGYSFSNYIFTTKHQSTPSSNSHAPSSPILKEKGESKTILGPKISSTEFNPLSLRMERQKPFWVKNLITIIRSIIPSQFDVETI